MQINYNSLCCGMKELGGLQNYSYSSSNMADAMVEVCKIIYPTHEENDKHLAWHQQRAKESGVNLDINPQGYLGHSAYNGCFENPEQYGKFRFLTFSAHRHSVPEPPDGGHYGEKFAAFIRECKLGTLAETGWQVNPNSGNEIKIWVWGIDHAALQVWYKAALKTQPKKKESIWDAIAPPSSPASAPYVGDIFAPTQQGLGSTQTCANVQSPSVSSYRVFTMEG